MNLRSTPGLRTLTLVSVVALGLAACSEEGDVTDPEPATGAAAIDADPDDVAFAWSLAGPEEFGHDGSGDEVVGELAPGEYTVTWREANGWITPGTTTRTVAADDTVAFRGVYAAGTGTVTIDPEPGGLTPPWSLTGPEGTVHTGAGDQTLTGMTVGEYTIAWGDVAGWISPEDETDVLAADDPLTLTGTYTLDDDAGIVEIDPDPDELSAPWSLTGPNGLAESGSGDEILAGVPHGDYTIDWAEVEGWMSPPNETAALTSSETPLVLGGTYTQEARTIVIDPDPDELEAPWSLIGPDGYEAVGSGDATLTDLTVGEYTIIWGDVNYHVTPPSETVTLSAVVSRTFQATYQRATGTVAVDPGPDALDAPWTLTGPEGFTANDAGDRTLDDVAAGEYTIAWGDVDGWIAPPDETLPLPGDETVTFAGTYVRETGSAVMDPNPDHLLAPWTLTGPDGFEVSDQGDLPLDDLVVGDYTAAWGEVDGWVTPPDETLPVVADESVVFHGDYVRATGTILVVPEPADLGAPWTLTGPDDIVATGEGTQVLNDMEAGEYTLTWEDVSGWLTPPPETEFLEADGNVDFRAEYLPLGEYVAIAAGTFTMGSPPGELGRHDDEVQHEVTLTTPFQMAQTEVTNQQFALLATLANSRGYCQATTGSLRDNLDGSLVELLDLDSDACEIYYQPEPGTGFFFPEEGTEDHPVKAVTWYGAAAYCDWLSLFSGRERAYDHGNWACNDRDPYGAEGFRLPTEAEWEYACRAGSQTAFNAGEITHAGCADDLLDDVAWYCGNAGGWTHPVGEFDANAWGLEDIHGNLNEFCNDRYGAYGGDVTDPVGPDGPGGTRLIRGGGWLDVARRCRSADRFDVAPGFSSGNVGFRPVRSAE